VVVQGLLRGFELKFKGTGGMATVDEKSGGHLHGVLHWITPKEMALLDSIESVYKRLPVDIQLYDGTIEQGSW
jgi:hypothetical protein